MLVYLNNCEKCLDHLHKKCAWSVVFYLSLTKMATKDGKIFLKRKKYIPFAHTMRILEREGFIVTTEEGMNKIRVIMLGHKINVDKEDESHYFCVFPDKHRI